MSLVTSAEAKLFLGIDHTDDDTLIGELVDQVTAAVEKHTDRSYTEAETTDYLDGGSKNLVVTNPPIASIDAIYDTFDSDAEEDSDDYDYDPIGGLIYRDPTSVSQSDWLDGRRRWKVVYDGGTDGAPDDVKAAALTWIADLYEHRDAVSSGRIGDMNYTRDAQRMPDRVRLMLAPHRIISI